MNQIVRRPAANRDLVGIFRRYARKAGLRVADRFFAEAELKENQIMGHSAARLSPAAFLLALSLPSAGVAQDEPPRGPVRQPAAVTRSDLGFLEVGRAYYIKFPDDLHPVLKWESGSEVGSAVMKSESGTTTTQAMPLNWSMKYQVNVFVIRKLGGGSWALLEHPVDPKAALSIMSARHQLSDKARIAVMEATEEGRQRLARIRGDAGGELKTTRTWINLGHAISISDPPDSSENWKLDIQVKAISRE